MEQKSLNSLTSLRFASAILILIHHGGAMLWPESWLERMGALAYVGVGFFFMLSGFVLAWSYNFNLPIRYFYGRRFARIFPAHIMTAAIAALMLISFSRGPEPLPLMANILLIQAWFPWEEFASSLNGISWSLSCEAFFYCIFPFAIRRTASVDPRHGIMLIYIMLILAAGLAVALLSADLAQQILYKNPVYRIGAFLIGMFGARLVRQGVGSPSVEVGLALFVLSYVACTAITYLTLQWQIRVPRGVVDLAMLPSIFLLIVSAALSDIGGRSQWLRQRHFVRLGEASFALYMVHWLIFYMSSVYLIHGPQLVIFSVAVAIILGLLFFYAIERPIEKRLRLMIGTPRTRLYAVHGVPS